MMIIGIGIDTIELWRIKQVLDTHGQRFTHRIFTATEREFCDARGAMRASVYAGRFAAKEAVLKAIGTGLRKGVRWKDIEITNESSGRPVARLSGRALEHARRIGITNILISISHGREYVVAQAIAVGQ